MLTQGFSNTGTVSIIIFDSLDLTDPSESIKGLIVKLVNMGHVRIGNNYIRQCLHVTKSVGNSAIR